MQPHLIAAKSDLSTDQSSKRTTEIRRYVLSDLQVHRRRSLVLGLGTCRIPYRFAWISLLISMGAAVEVFFGDRLG